MTEQDIKSETDVKKISSFPRANSISYYES